MSLRFQMSVLSQFGKIIIPESDFPVSDLWREVLDLLQPFYTTCRETALAERCGLEELIWCRTLREWKTCTETEGSFH